MRQCSLFAQSACNSNSAGWTGYSSFFGTVTYSRTWTTSHTGSITTSENLPCHYYCNGCTVSWNKNYCSSCWNQNGDTYQWLNWGSTNSYTSICQTTCPDDQYHGNTNTVIGQYISSTTNRYCYRCNSLCSTCNNLGTGN